MKADCPSEGDSIATAPLELVKKNDLLHFVEQTNSRFDTYHGRKETAAWLALVLYVLICFQMADFEADGLEWVVTAWMTVLALTFLIYISQQIGNRNEASLIVSACSEIEAQLLAEGRESLPVEEYPLALGTSGKRQIDYLLPAFLADRKRLYRDRGGVPGRAMDFARYTIFVMSTVLAFAAIWRVDELV